MRSTPVVIAVPHPRARPRDASSARLNAPACHADVGGSVPTSRPRPDTTSNRQGRGNLRIKRVQGREEDGADKTKGRKTRVIAGG